MRALVVDDEQGMREIFREVLEGKGLEVLEAGCGADAIELARTKAPVVVILDLKLVGTDGWEVMRRLRASKGTKNSTIIVCSGTLDHDFEGVGDTTFLCKPVNLKQFELLIDEAVLKHGGTA